MAGLSARERVLQDFDPARILWGLERPAVTLPYEFGIDPKHPSYIVRPFYAPPSRSGNSVTIHEMVAASSEELERFKGPGLTVPDHFYAPFYEAEDGELDGYLYVRRLHHSSETPDPHNPAHIPYLHTLGGIILNYLEATPVGGRFSDEYCHIDQCKIGRLWGVRKAAAELYLVDLDPQDINHRETPGTPACNRDQFSFGEIAAEARCWLGAAAIRHPSKTIHGLVERADALCVEATGRPYDPSMVIDYYRNLWQ